MKPYEFNSKRVGFETQQGSLEKFIESKYSTINNEKQTIKYVHTIHFYMLRRSKKASQIVV